MFNTLKIFVIGLCLIGVVSADSIRLKNDTVINGKIISEDATTIQIEPTGMPAGSLLGFDKENIASLTKTVGGKTVLVGLIPLIKKPVAKAVLLSEPSDIFDYADKLIEAGNITKAVKAIDSLYSETNPPLNKLQKLGSIQDAYFHRWIEVFNSQITVSVAKSDGSKARLGTPVPFVKTIRGNGYDNGDYPVHYDGYGHLIRPSRYYNYEPRYIAMGQDSDKMVYENNLRKAQQEIEDEQKRQAKINENIQVISDLFNRCALYTTSSIDLIKARENEQTLLSIKTNQVLEKTVATAPVVYRIKYRDKDENTVIEPNKRTVKILEPKTEDGFVKECSMWLIKNSLWIFLPCCVLALIKAFGIILK